MPKFATSSGKAVAKGPAGVSGEADAAGKAMKRGERGVKGSVPGVRR